MYDHSCPLDKGRYIALLHRGGGPEYETIWAFGAQTGTSDLEAIIKANSLCNQLGLDTISMRHVIGTLMELIELGKIPGEKL